MGRGAEIEAPLSAPASNFYSSFYELIRRYHRHQKPLDLLLSYMILIKYRLIEYTSPNGRIPFRAWLESLPVAVAARVQARLYAAELGNLGDCKTVGAGVFELRVHLGPGYRVYFGREGAVVLILLGGGTKGTQKRDIERAKKYWSEFRGSKNATKKC